MSVRDFANHPCPVCKSDTLHVAMVCSVCGTKQIHPFEQFENREPKKKAGPRTRQHGTRAANARGSRGK